ncbi:MAG: hypothetical protein U1F43_12370 [Myxococcota bacterium]
MHRRLAWLSLALLAACGDDGGATTDTRGSDAPDTSGGGCTLTAEMQHTGSGSQFTLTAHGALSCRSPHDLQVATTLEWKDAADPETAWSEVQTATQSGSDDTTLESEASSSLLCPLNGGKVWRAVVHASVDGAALDAETSSELGGLCP